MKSDKVDHIVKVKDIKKTAYLPLGKLYDTDTIVSKNEVSDSILLKDSPFEFVENCRVSSKKLQLVDE